MAKVLRERRACESAAFRCGVASASAKETPHAQRCGQRLNKNRAGSKEPARFVEAPATQCPAPCRRWRRREWHRLGWRRREWHRLCPLGASPRPLRADCQPGIPLSTPRVSRPEQERSVTCRGGELHGIRTMFWGPRHCYLRIGATSPSSTTGATDVSGLEPDLVPEPSSLPAGEMSSDVGGFEVYRVADRLLIGSCPLHIQHE